MLILDGRLALHTRLPGERELAAALEVSRTTIGSRRWGFCAKRVIWKAATAAGRA